MTDAPPSRKTHVIRILGTNRNGDVLSDLWADVERIDSAQTVKSDGDYQGVVRNLKWFDDPDGPDGVVEPRTRDGESVGDGSRDVTTVKVCDPSTTDFSDPDEWVPIDAIKHMRSMRGDQGVVDKFVNHELTDARVVVKRRTVHRDTNIDDLAQAAFDADPDRKVYVIPGDQYTFIDGTDDDSQYVEQEVVIALKDLRNIDSKTGSGDDQGAQTKLLNQYIIDQTTEAQLNELGDGGFNPPYRLDPYQTIVNVSVGGCTQFDSFDDGIRSYIGAPHCGESTSQITIAIAFRVLTPDEIKQSTAFAGEPLADQVNGNVCFIYDDPVNPDINIPAFSVNPTAVSFNMCGNSYDSVTGFSRNPAYDPDGAPPQFDILEMPSGLFQVGASFSFDNDPNDGHFHIAVISIDASGSSSALLGDLNDNDPATSIFLGRFGSGVTVKATLDGVVGQKEDIVPIWEGDAPPDQTWASLVAPDPATPDDGSFGNIGDFAPVYRRLFYEPPPDRIPSTFDEFFNYPPVVAQLDGARAYVTGNNLAIASIQMWSTYIEPEIFIGTTDSGELIMVNPKTTAEAYGQPILWCQGTPATFMKNKAGPVFMDKVGYVQPYSKKPVFK